MDFAIVFVAVAALSAALRNAIKKAPGVWYVLAAAAVLVLFVGTSLGFKGDWWGVYLLLTRRCMAAFALFAVVMFIGVFGEGSKVGLWMRPIRAELSIVAWILCMGHVCLYVPVYVSRLLGGTVRLPVLASIAIAAVLFVLLLALGATSLSAIKRRMKSASWKRLQRFSYLFFALCGLHLLLMLLPAAASGAAQAQASLAVYAALFACYVALRVRRFAVDRRSVQPAREGQAAGA